MKLTGLRGIELTSHGDGPRLGERQRYLLIFYALVEKWRSREMWQCGGLGTYTFATLPSGEAAKSASGRWLRQSTGAETLVCSF